MQNIMYPSPENYFLRYSVLFLAREIYKPKVDKLAYWNDLILLRSPKRVQRGERLGGNPKWFRF